MSLIRQGLDPSGLEVTQGYHSGSGGGFSSHGVIVQGFGSPQLLIRQGYAAGARLTIAPRFYAPVRPAAFHSGRGVVLLASHPQGGGAPAAQGAFLPGAGFLNPVYLPKVGFIYAAPARVTQFRSMGDLDMAMQPIVPSLLGPVLRSGDAGFLFSGDFNYPAGAGDLATGESLTGVTFTVLGSPALYPGSTEPDPAGTWTDVTRTVAPTASLNPSPSASSGTAIGTVGVNSATGIASIAQTTGLGGATKGWVYTVLFFVTTSSGRTIQDAIVSIASDM